MPGPGLATRTFLRTREGVIVLVYVDRNTFKRGWDDARGEPEDDVRADVWSVRSLDDGETWVNRHRIMEGYCGALINMIETQRGPIVVPVQMLLHDRGRHGQATFASRDQGKTWERSNITDLGGRGHHEGAFVATISELGDRSLWMLVRTNWDRFWEAFSVDEGLSWRVYNPSEINASSSPGYLLRLSAAGWRSCGTASTPRDKRALQGAAGNCQGCEQAGSERNAPSRCRTTTARRGSRLP